MLGSMLWALLHVGDRRVRAGRLRRRRAGVGVVTMVVLVGGVLLMALSACRPCRARFSEGGGDRRRLAGWGGRAVEAVRRVDAPVEFAGAFVCAGLVVAGCSR
ncbi:hypothetical protein, partial [Thermobifida halotolerans]|uniref:hypothetical protein n=1 Tax=Thermobifida halotolerans TaxID=483545 RepID=UPI001F28A42D